MSLFPRKYGIEAAYVTVRVAATVFVVTGIISMVATGCAQKSRKSGGADKVLTHVVAQGETLEDIADDYYGDPKRAHEIRNFNDLKSDELKYGDTVRVKINGVVVNEATRSTNTLFLKRCGEIVQPLGLGEGVIVYKGDDVASGKGDADVAGH